MDAYTISMLFSVGFITVVTLYFCYQAFKEPTHAI